ncbi:unnamed protein product [Schistocephalus solidus]|uniref:RWD domain-containing protein n=1 Tax=Schistocephalus solidus TaxID=70667 RepID=A0A183SPB5_SCHSO|nr:unnamed protein product [Schistocephalus solidus]
MATANEGLDNINKNVDLKDGFEELKNFKSGCTLLREAINLAWQAKKAKEKPRAKVFIEGDSDLARSVNTTGIPRSDEGDADPSELEEHERPAAKRKGRHKSKTVAELGDQAASKHDIPHPLSVCVRISEEPSLKCPNFTLIIRFSWLRKSNLVSVQTYFEQPEFLDPLSQTGRAFVDMASTVCCSPFLPPTLNYTLISPLESRDLLESENLLSGLEFAVLESADTPGQVLPLSRLAMDSPEPSFLPKLPPSQLGRAFMWAQQLAGLQCLPSLPSAIATGALRWEKRPIQQAAAGASVDGSQSVQPSTFGFIDTWFSAVMRRVQSRLLLNSELRAIEDGILNLSEHQKPFFPITEEIGLRTWDRITLDELKSWPRAETFIALDLIQPSDAIFQCQMTYRNRDTLSIGVAIPPCYPDEPSLIILGSVIEPFPTKDITVLHIQVGCPPFTCSPSLRLFSSIAPSVCARLPFAAVLPSPSLISLQSNQSTSLFFLPPPPPCPSHPVFSRPFSPPATARCRSNPPLLSLPSRPFSIFYLAHLVVLFLVTIPILTPFSNYLIIALHLFLCLLFLLLLLHVLKPKSVTVVIIILVPLLRPFFFFFFFFFFSSFLELETEVNCFWRELPPEEQEDEVEEAEGKGKSERTTRCSSSVPSPPENLLSCQLARLASCLPLLWAAPNDPGALAALRGKPGVRCLRRATLGDRAPVRMAWRTTIHMLLAA